QILSINDFKTHFGIAYWSENGTLIDTPEKDTYNSLIAASFLWGCVLGAGSVSYLADWIGRKFSIILGGLIFTAGGAVQAASYTLTSLLIARATSGFSVGIMSMCVPLYIAETSPTRIRGALTTVYQLMITFGILIASCINGIILAIVNSNSPVSWRLAFAFQTVPGASLFFVMLFMPRSPRWLAQKERHEEGLAAIAKLRGAEDPDDDEVIVEYRSIMAGVELERKIGKAEWSELLRPGVRKRVAIGIFNQFFQQWTGINFILYYDSFLFRAMGFPDAQANIAFIIVNAFINFISTFPGMWGVERFGRRPLMIYGGMVMTLSHVWAFVFTWLTRNPDQPVPAAAWLALVGIYSFVISFACTWGPVVWTYQSEIFPLRIRAKGTGVSTISNWFWNAVIAQTTIIIFTKLVEGLLLVFAASCFIMTIYAYFFIPETRGKTLEQMDEVFKDSESILPQGVIEWGQGLFSMHINPRNRQPGGTVNEGEETTGEGEGHNRDSSTNLVITTGIEKPRPFKHASPVTGRGGKTAIVSAMKRRKPPVPDAVLEPGLYDGSGEVTEMQDLSGTVPTPASMARGSSDLLIDGRGGSVVGIPESVSGVNSSSSSVSAGLYQQQQQAYQQQQQIIQQHQQQQQHLQQQQPRGGPVDPSLLSDDVAPMSIISATTPSQMHRMLGTTASASPRPSHQTHHSSAYSELSHSNATDAPSLMTIPASPFQSQSPSLFPMRRQPQSQSQNVGLPPSLQQQPQQQQHQPRLHYTVDATPVSALVASLEEQVSGRGGNGEYQQYDDEDDEDAFAEYARRVQMANAAAAVAGGRNGQGRADPRAEFGSEYFAQSHDDGGHENGYYEDHSAVDGWRGDVDESRR
ncbi:hypothetical protein HDU76_008297, partial [Blyttiomyces sp. JEL0837]